MQTLWSTEHLRRCEAGARFDATSHADEREDGRSERQTSDEPRLARRPLATRHEPRPCVDRTWRRHTPLVLPRGLTSHPSKIDDETLSYIKPRRQHHPRTAGPATMDEIFALQAALSAAQEQKSQIRLSERNIVELVNKLKACELLDDTLLYTLNGKEYVTQERLRAEIKREVKRSGGRVPVVDLQPLLNVDVVHCERQAKALADDPSVGFSLVEGELMTPAYFDAVAAEVDEELREAGMVGVGDLARRHSLSADLMRKVLSERMVRTQHDRTFSSLKHKKTRSSHRILKWTSTNKSTCVYV